MIQSRQWQNILTDDDDKYDKALEFVYTLREAIEAIEPVLKDVKDKAALLA